MILPFEYLLLGASVLLLLSVIASKASWRFGVPSLLLFLVIGMLAGSDGPGGIHFDNPPLAQSLGVVALAFILFAGGLDTEWRRVRQVLGKGLILSTFGVGITALLVGWYATTVLKVSWLEGLLIGSIVSSTDAAAVFAVLRSRNVRLRGLLKPLLELESGSNDPMAVFLTVGLIGLLTGSTASVVDLIPRFFLQMALGAGVGYGMGTAMAWLVNRLQLEYDGLYPVLTLSLVLLAYSATATVGGNGFLAVYMAGLIMSRSQFRRKRSVVQFHDGLAWLMQIVMFLTLGLQVFPSQLVPVASAGLLLALFLMVCARPIAVFLTLSFSRIGLREKIMVAWVGLRGAVPIILATFPLVAGIPQAPMIFNVVFFIVLTSILLQGTSIPLVARWLKVDAPLSTESSGGMLEVPSVRTDTGAIMEFRIASSSRAVGERLSDLDLPAEALSILVIRQGQSFVPPATLELQINDTVVIFADRAWIGNLSALFGSPPVMKERKEDSPPREVRQVQA